jgi:hypothetical protein
MSDEGYFFFSAPTGNDRELCLAPLTDREALQAGYAADDVDGYFLFERVVSSQVEDIVVLAHVTSEEAAVRLSRLLRLQ